ncbi:hypothetical protein D3C81_776520 [compost metagenome]
MVHGFFSDGIFSGIDRSDSGEDIERQCQCAADQTAGATQPQGKPGFGKIHKGALPGREHIRRNFADGDVNNNGTHFRTNTQAVDGDFGGVVCFDSIHHTA